MATTYFNRTDLDARLQRTACWLATEANKIKDSLKITGKVKPCRMNNFMYVSAALEALEHYTPITTSAQDGVDNCLTEAEAEQLFNNISKITHLCFVPKHSTYESVVDDDNNQYTTPVTSAAAPMTRASGSTIRFAFTTRETSIYTA